MNPGYLSFVLISIAAVLLASGWKDTLLRGVSGKLLLLFFPCWIAASSLTVTVAGNIRINLVLAVLAVLTASAIGGYGNLLEKIHHLSLGLLLASVYFAMQVLVKLDPGLFFRFADLNMAAASGLMAALSARHPGTQTAVLSIGLVVGDFLYLYAARDLLPMELGHRTFQDRWWLSIFFARGFTLFFAFVVAACREMKQVWLAYRNGRRNG